MRIGDVGRLACMFALVGATLVTAISCGGSGSSETVGDASLDGMGILNLEAGVANNCKPKTCMQQGYTCGWNSDGCGNAIQCGGCTDPDYCGGGGYSKCGAGNAGGDAGVCVPKTCADFPASTCGQQADGCGGLTANCSTCTTPAFCGGGGPSLCGTGDAGGDAGVCVPKTCADYPMSCGQQGDGCGSLTVNCGTCTDPEFCGGNPAAPGTCGGNNGLGPDGGPIVQPCIPKTCAALGNPCGVAGDGCGGLTPVCTTCTSPAYCGGGGTSKCGTGTDSGAGGTDGGTGGSCTPKTCANYPANTCGAQSDGCGGLTANCGTCTNPAYCGGGGPGLCGGNDGKTPDGAIASQCVPKTCAGLGYNCGQAGDGCGGIIGPCGPACIAPQVCGGGGSPNVCGSNIPCTGLCQQQVACDGGTTTTLTGYVRSGLQEGATSWVPAGTVPDPVPGVLVYIPTTAITPFDSNPNAPQVQCSQCGADVSGNPLVEATTDYTGKFTLSNVPVSTSATDTIPIVIQLGHWRRQYSFAILNPCTQNTLTAAMNLPSSSTEGDIPLTAISTGSYDPIECVLLKMGINQNEFMSYTTWAAETATGTAPKQGRVHIYTATAAETGGTANANPGATLAPRADETALMGTGATGSATNGNYMDYDQILLPCWGGPVPKSAAELFDLGYYGDHGGHFFATHFSYSWLSGNNNSQLNSIANWDLRADDNDTPTVNGTMFTGDVSNTVPPTVPVTNPGVFVQWLNYVGALSNGNPAGAPPAAPTVAITAGRHDVDSVANGSVEWIDGTDPNGAVNSKATPPTAEMLLHFTFDMPIAATSGQCGHGIFSDFHVNSATQSNGKTFPNECDQTALNSQERIIEYMIWDLSSCVPGTPTATCTPKTCADYPTGTCGQQGDGCGGLTANCSTCPTGQVCGGCGVAGQCCAEDAGMCTPETCAAFTGACGQQSDGCGGLTAACACPAGQMCVSGTCESPPDGGASSCVPQTCAAYPAGTCGQQSDGCGGLTPDCNPCPMGQTCGGCGVSGMCCAPPSSMCTPQPCPADVLCGPASDGCGGIIASCGTCTAPQTCGGCGTPGMCCGNSGCTPLTCAQQNITCGPAGDGCGNLIAGGCGTCTSEGGCVPQTCAELNINCGPAGDGCGNLIPSCGTCTGGETCGSNTPGQCGTPIAQ
ncbi:MAG: hypothetical protein ACLP1X_23290 [Polyangiaceae bacterium]